MGEGIARRTDIALARINIRVRGAFAALSALLVMASGLPAHADESDTTPVEASPTSGERLLPTGTEVMLRLLEPVASNTHPRGKRFKLEVMRDVFVDGALVIPAGAMAHGEVIHAAKPGMAGKAGELIVTSRFIQVGDRTVKLRSFTAAMGEHRLNLATALGVTVGIPGLFVVGKNIVVPAGTEVVAKAAENVALPAISALAPQIGEIAAPMIMQTEGEVREDAEVQP